MTARRGGFPVGASLGENTAFSGSVGMRYMHKSADNPYRASIDADIKPYVIDDDSEEDGNTLLQSFLGSSASPKKRMASGEPKDNTNAQPTLIPVRANEVEGSEDLLGSFLRMEESDHEDDHEDIEGNAFSTLNS
ncbi:hypothetical protein KEM55_005277, partial [Ascosphaera atra]